MNWQRVQAELEQESARLRDARPPVSVPEMDLYLLVLFATIGADIMLAMCAGENEEVRERAQRKCRDQAQRVADALGRPGQPRSEAGVRAAGKLIAIIGDRYEKYLPTDEGGSGPGESGAEQ